MTLSDNPLFKFTLIDINKPTADGRIYTIDVCNMICLQCNTNKKLSIQELNIVERKQKNIRLDESWDKKAMAYIKNAEIVNDKLIIEAECKTTRDGKKLVGMLKTKGINAFQFVPVGYGIVDNNIVKNYQLIYIAVEPS